MMATTDTWQMLGVAEARVIRLLKRLEKGRCIPGGGGVHLLQVVREGLGGLEDGQQLGVGGGGVICLQHGGHQVVESHHPGGHGAVAGAAEEGGGALPLLGAGLVGEAALEACTTSAL